MTSGPPNRAAIETRPSAAIETRPSAAIGTPPRPAIETRLRSAGLPPLPRTSWLEIDLDRLRANLAAIRAVVPDGTRVEPVVKADAYGHGMLPVARTLEAAGADGFGLATFDEAIALRDAGITAPILVLYPVPADAAGEAARRSIALTIGDRTLTERLLAAAGSLDPGARLDVHIEVETGLGRGGLAPGEVADAVAALAMVPAVRLAGLWSHLAAAADAGRSAAQVELFGAAVTLLGDGGVTLPARHLAASGGVLAATAPALDAVRPGLAIYGLVPEGIVPATPGARDLQPVMSLHARPVRVAELPAGHGVGYGPTFTTTRPSRIATLPFGYGDGFARVLSNRASALVRGVRVPLVGTIAMDAVLADVTDVPGTAISVDDEFVFLGEQGDERITALDLARQRTTISWEVVAGMAARFPRVYHAAAGLVATRTLAGETSAWEQGGRGTHRTLER